MHTNNTFNDLLHKQFDNKIIEDNRRNCTLQASIGVNDKVCMFSISSLKAIKRTCSFYCLFFMQKMNRYSTTIRKV